MFELPLARVQTALLVLGDFPPPAPGARILARHHRARAGRAANRAVALVVEPVVGNLVRAHVLPHVSLAPRGERVELVQTVVEVELALGERGAAGRMLAALAGNPCALAGECAAQRLDLADLAAALAQLDAAVEGVAPVGRDVLLDRARVGLIYIQRNPVA